VRSQTYEITVTGQARSRLRAEFDDGKISTGPCTTTLRAELPDQGALCGLVRRIADLGLEVVDMHVIARWAMTDAARSWHGTRLPPGCPEEPPVEGTGGFQWAIAALAIPRTLPRLLR
jgi:hypothetical protein